jgi:uncharacterized protein YbjQ (UPF0145 family)
MRAVAAYGLAAILAPLAVACVDENGAQASDPSVVAVSPPGATTIIVNGKASIDAVPAPTEGSLLSVSDPASRVRIYTSKDIEGEVVGVLDFHTRADSQDKGFDELKRRAAEMGADAVIGAEFEHGDEGAVSHLSGMAVRLHSVPR